MIIHTKKYNRGFTLIELMIVLVIIGILSAVAFPSYKASIQQSRRSVAKAELTSLSVYMEQVFAENYSYKPSNVTPVLPFTQSPREGGTKFYDLTVVSTPTSYTLTATPKGDQTTDLCGTLSINYLGVQSAAKTNCW